MKIIATIKDATESFHVGTDVHCISCIIDVPEDKIPHVLMDHFRHEKAAQEYIQKFPTGQPQYLASVSFSIMDGTKP